MSWLTSRAGGGGRVGVRVLILKQKITAPPLFRGTFHNLTTNQTQYISTLCTRREKIHKISFSTKVFVITIKCDIWIFQL